MLWFRDRGSTEIGGFGITPADDLLYIEDFLTVKQAATAVGVSFDDAAVSGFVDDQVDAGRQPAQVLRVWCHSHPGESAEPSCVDEETFARVFGNADHAVMFVIGKGGKTHARLRFNVGPGGDLLIPAEIDYSRPFNGSDFEAWEAEYQANIKPDRGRFSLSRCLGWDDWTEIGTNQDDGNSDVFGADLCMDDVMLAELVEMDPCERDHILAEFGLSPEDLADEVEVHQ